MGQIINGQIIADQILKSAGERLKRLIAKGFKPKLAVVLIGQNRPSLTYIKKKAQAAKKIGLNFKLERFAKNVKQKKLLAKMALLQRDPNLVGLIVQLPIPKHLNTTAVLNAVKPKLDVDCLTTANTKGLKSKNPYLIPPTPAAILAILTKLKIRLNNKPVTILGKGALVGRPLSILMKKAKAHVTMIDSQTKEVKQKCLAADIIITAVGKRNLLRGEMIKLNAVVIDAGICFVNKKVYGDVNIKEATKKASFITPTPGGVGPITVAYLLNNTAINAERIFLTKR